MKRVALKAVGYVGMISLWFGCVLSAGYRFDNFLHIPLSKGVFWIVGIALVLLEGELSKRNPQNDVGGLNFFRSAVISGIAFNVGFVLFTINCFFLVLIRFFKNLNLNLILHVSFYVMIFSILLLVLYDFAHFNKAKDDG